MPRRITLKHALVAALATSILAASPALAKPTDHVRYDSAKANVYVPPAAALNDTVVPANDSPKANVYVPPAAALNDTVAPANEGRTSSLAGTASPKQDLRGEYARDAARAAETDTSFQVGQPTWPIHPAPAVAPAKPKSIPAANTDGGDDLWLVLGIGLAASGIVAGSAAGVVRRTRRVAV
jgi:hypothetical protein